MLCPVQVADLGVSRQVAQDESMLKTFQGEALSVSVLPCMSLLVCVRVHIN